MIAKFRQWLTRKWSRSYDASLLDAYRVTFTSLHGQHVLEHLITSVYATVYEGKDAFEAGVHNGRRSVIHEILENIDRAERPDKYETPVVTEERDHARS